MKGTVSCGNALSAKAAHSMLDIGGNAFDAAVAGSFSSFVTEGMLTSAAAGGIAVLHPATGKPTCVDFLSDFPSRPEVKPVKRVVNFGDETQEFFLGGGSNATPGSLFGLLEIQRKYCKLELSKILAPAIKYAKGFRLDSFQEYVNTVLLDPFARYSRESRRIFERDGKPIKAGETMRNLEFAAFLELLAKDKKGALGFFLDNLEATLETTESALTIDDVQSYKVGFHKPVTMKYRGLEIELSAPPSAGGVLIANALNVLGDYDISNLKHNSAEHIRLLVQAMQQTDSRRTMAFFENVIYNPPFWKKFLKKPNRIGSTTHISVLDSEGNAAGITSSIGEGSGIMVKNTGIMLNNFATEPDLMQYRGIYRPGHRITSMMCPAIFCHDKCASAVLGSGGSNRIRSAIFQTISNMVDFGMPPQKATDAARVHYEDKVLQLEKGIRLPVAKELSKEFKTNIWSKKSMFFGGVHIATPDSGGGDKRRGGAVISD